MNSADESFEKLEVWRRSHVEACFKLIAELREISRMIHGFIKSLDR